ncbi:MAG: DoxX family protein [Planctomycetota bacterium]
MVQTLSLILRVLIGLGLLNVWLIRAGGSTDYRGGASQSLKEEFRTYGLPDVMFYVVGFLKVSAALVLLAGNWVPDLVLPAAATVVVLMLGALAMHVKVKDPVKKSVPAAFMLALNATVVALQLT